MDKKLLGARLRKHRKQQKLTIHQLAEMVDVSDVFLGSIERGQKLPSLETFLRIVNTLGISADVLLQDELDSGRQFMVDDLTKNMLTLEPKQLRVACGTMNRMVELLKENIN